MIGQEPSVCALRQTEAERHLRGKYIAKFLSWASLSTERLRPCTIASSANPWVRGHIEGGMATPALAMALEPEARIPCKFEKGYPTPSFRTRRGISPEESQPPARFFVAETVSQIGHPDVSWQVHCPSAKSKSTYDNDFTRSETGASLLSWVEGLFGSRASSPISVALPVGNSTNPSELALDPKRELVRTRTHLIHSSGG